MYNREGKFFEEMIVSGEHSNRRSLSSQLVAAQIIHLFRHGDHFRNIIIQRIIMN